MHPGIDTMSRIEQRLRPDVDELLHGVARSLYESLPNHDCDNSEGDPEQPVYNALNAGIGR